MEMTKEDQVLYLIKEKPGITSKEIADFFEMDMTPNQVSAKISIVYSRGDIRREPHIVGPRQRGFRYWYEPGAKPQMLRTGKKAKQLSKPTPAACEVRLKEAEEKIVELERWKADAIARYPDLAVKPIVLRARQLAADEYPNDLGMRQAILRGEKDHSPVVRAVLKALEAAG